MRKLALLAVALSACSEFTATPSATDGGVIVDAGTSVDALAPTTDSGEPPTPRSCPVGATCIDFEDPSPRNDVRVEGDGCALEALGNGHALHCQGTRPSYFELVHAFDPASPSLSFRAYIRGVPPKGNDALNLGYVGFFDTTLASPVMMVGDPNISRTYDLLFLSTIASGSINSQVPDGSSTWVCVEAVFTAPHDRDPSTTSFFIDGNPVDVTRVNVTLGTTPVFRWGLAQHPMGQRAEVFIDDIVIGTQRIGCN